GEGRIAVVALDDRTTVDGQDVALFEGVLAGNTWDYHVVGRRADHRWISPVMQEVGLGVPAGQDVAGDGVELCGGHTGLGRFPGGLVHLRHDPSGPAHLGYLLGAASHRAFPLPRRSSTARMIRRSTASGDPTPLTLASCPRDSYHLMSGAVWRS